MKSKLVQNSGMIRQREDKPNKQWKVNCDADVVMQLDGARMMLIVN